MIVRIKDFKSDIPPEWRKLIGDDRYVVSGCSADKTLTVAEKEFPAVDDKKRLVTFVSSDSQIDRDEERIARGAFHKTIENYKRAGAPVITGHLKRLENGMCATAGKCVEMLTDADPFISVVRFIPTATGDDHWIAYSEGAQRGISVSFRAIDVAKEDGVPVIREAELLEQSLVVVPANPRAVAIDIVQSELGKAAAMSHDDGEVRELKAALDELTGRIDNLFGKSPVRSKAVDVDSNKDAGDELTREEKSAIESLFARFDV